MIYTESHLKAATLQIKHHYQWDLQWNSPLLLCDFDHLASCLQNLDQLCQVYPCSLSNSYRWMMSQWIRETNVSFLFLPSEAFFKKVLQTVAEGWHAWMQRSRRHLHSSHRDTLKFSKEPGAYQTQGCSDSSLKGRGGGSWRKKVTTLNRFHRLWTRDEGNADVRRRQVFFDQSPGVGASKARIETQSQKPSPDTFWQFKQFHHQYIYLLLRFHCVKT